MEAITEKMYKILVLCGDVFYLVNRFIQHEGGFKNLLFV